MEECIGCGKDIEASFNLRMKIVNSSGHDMTRTALASEELRPHHIHKDSGEIDICPKCFENSTVHLDIEVNG